jgi:hypothetical protein
VGGDLAFHRPGAAVLVAFLVRVNGRHQLRVTRRYVWLDVMLRPNEIVKGWYLKELVELDHTIFVLIDVVKPCIDFRVSHILLLLPTNYRFKVWHSAQEDDVRALLRQVEDSS